MTKGSFFGEICESHLLVGIKVSIQNTARNYIQSNDSCEFFLSGSMISPVRDSWQIFKPELEFLPIERVLSTIRQQLVTPRM